MHEAPLARAATGTHMARKKTRLVAVDVEQHQNVAAHDDACQCRCMLSAEIFAIPTTLPDLKHDSAPDMWQRRLDASLAGEGRQMKLCCSGQICTFTHR
jgi:hypothetical protein